MLREYELFIDTQKNHFCYLLKFKYDNIVKLGFSLKKLDNLEDMFPLKLNDCIYMVTTITPMKRVDIVYLQKNCR